MKVTFYQAGRRLSALRDLAEQLCLGFQQSGCDRTRSILRASLSEEQLASLMAEGAAFDQTTAVAEAMATLALQKA